VEDTVLKIRLAYGKLLYGFAVLGGAATFAIMWVIVANAIGRKLFNSPLPAALEITQSLLVLSLMLPFALALLQREHVNTVFLTSRLSERSRRLLYIFWMIVGCILFALVTYGTFRYGLRSLHMNEQTWGAGLKFAIWPSKIAVSFGAFLITIQFAIEALCAIIVPSYSESYSNAPENAHV